MSCSCCLLTMGIEKVEFFFFFHETNVMPWTSAGCPRDSMILQPQKCFTNCRPRRHMWWCHCWFWLSLQGHRAVSARRPSWFPATNTPEHSLLWCTAICLGVILYNVFLWRAGLAQGYAKFLVTELSPYWWEFFFRNCFEIIIFCPTDTN